MMNTSSLQRTTQKILAMDVDVTCCADAVLRIMDMATDGHGHYVCVSNVHMCMETYDSETFQAVVNGADMVVPDGRPLVWAQRWISHADAEQVRGADVFSALCEEAEKKGVSVGLYGGTEATLDTLVHCMKTTFPDLHIDYAWSPPFRPLTDEEDRACVQAIADSGAKILFVGIGCPKQERWMAAHKDALPCVMLGVGAVFDFFSGSKKHAPRWMQKCGLEWLFRLACEPRRLWKRYLKQNPRFVYFFACQYFRYFYGKRD